MTAPARPGAQRKADALEKFAAIEGDAWVATASGAGAGHMVPLSYAWDGRAFLLSAPADSVTIRNITSSGRARLGFGPTRDVVIVDADLDRVTDIHDAPADVVDLYVRQAGWDPRAESIAYALAVLVPRRIQAWREANELAGKTLMRDGVWLI